MTTPTPRPNDHLAAVVLAGGMSRRLGRNKALEPIGGQPLITRVTDRLAQVAPKLVVVVNEAERAVQLPLPPHAAVAIDRFPGKGSLGGLYTGLAAAKDAGADWAVIVACDMPFLCVPLLQHMLSLRHDCDAVVPVLVDPSSPLEGLSLSGAKDNWRGVRGEDTPSPRAERGSGGEVARPEPLHAAYSVRCLPHMERRLLADDLKISNFFSDIRLRELPESAVRALDPDLLSFFNINTQADVDRAQSLAIQGR